MVKLNPKPKREKRDLYCVTFAFFVHKKEKENGEPYKYLERNIKNSLRRTKFLNKIEIKELLEVLVLVP